MGLLNFWKSNEYVKLDDEKAEVEYVEKAETTEVTEKTEEEPEAAVVKPEITRKKAIIYSVCQIISVMSQLYLSYTFCKIFRQGRQDMWKDVKEQVQKDVSQSGAIFKEAKLFLKVQYIATIIFIVTDLHVIISTIIMLVRFARHWSAPQDKLGWTPQSRPYAFYPMLLSLGVISVAVYWQAANFLEIVKDRESLSQIYSLAREN